VDEAGLRRLVEYVAEKIPAASAAVLERRLASVFRRRLELNLVQGSPGVLGSAEIIPLIPFGDCEPVVLVDHLRYGLLQLSLKLLPRTGVIAHIVIP